MPKDTKRKYWLVSGLYALFEKGSAFLFGFGSVFILYRTLEEEVMGTWVLFLMTCAFLEVSRIGLIQNALVKYLSAEPKIEHGKINAASFLLNGLLSLFYALLLLTIAPFLGQLWNPAIIPLLHIYILTTTILTLLYQCNFVLQANLSFKGIFMSNAIKQGIFFSFLLILWLLGRPIELIQLAWFQVFGAVVGSIIAIYFAWPFLVFSKKIDWGWIRKLLAFGKFAVSTNISTMLYKNMDKMMLGSLISAGSVVVYDLAIRITNALEIPVFSAAAVVFPQSAREMVDNGKEGVKKMYEHSVAAILALLLPVILFVEIFPEPLILLIAGEDYLSSTPILRLTILFGFFLPFANQMGTVLESIGKPNINFYCTALGFIINIIFNYLFILKYGVIGAAYGTLITYFITFIITQTILYKMLGVNILNVFLNLNKYYFQAYIFLKDKIKHFLIKPKTTTSNIPPKEQQS